MKSVASCLVELFNARRSECSEEENVYKIEAMERWVQENPSHSDVPKVREAISEIRKKST